jgi:hypothetical protein
VITAQSPASLVVPLRFQYIRVSYTIWTNPGWFCTARAARPGGRRPPPSAPHARPHLRLGGAALGAGRGGAGAAASVGLPAHRGSSSHGRVCHEVPTFVGTCSVKSVTINPTEDHETGASRVRPPRGHNCHCQLCGRVALRCESCQTGGICLRATRVKSSQERRASTPHGTTCRPSPRLAVLLVWFRCGVSRARYGAANYSPSRRVMDSEAGGSAMAAVAGCRRGSEGASDRKRNTIVSLRIDRPLTIGELARAPAQYAGSIHDRPPNSNGCFELTTPA